MLRGEERKSDGKSEIAEEKSFAPRVRLLPPLCVIVEGRMGWGKKQKARERKKGRNRPLPIVSPSFVCPQKFCISSLSSISLGDDCNTQLLCKRWGHWIRCIMGDVQMATNSLTFLSAGASADSKIWFCQLIASWVSGLRQGLGKRRGEGRGPSLFPLFAPYFSKSWY